MPFNDRAGHASLYTGHTISDTGHATIAAQATLGRLPTNVRHLRLFHGMRDRRWVGVWWTVALACAAIACMNEGSAAHHVGTDPDPGTVIRPTGGEEGRGPAASSIALPSRPSGDVA